MSRWWHGSDNYDEDEEERCQCDGAGYIFCGPDDEDGVEVCEQCSKPVELDDLEALMPALAAGESLCACGPC